MFNLGACDTVQLGWEPFGNSQFDLITIQCVIIKQLLMHFLTKFHFKLEKSDSYIN